MDFSADHIGFVAASYAITVAVLGGLLVWTFVRARTVASRLDVLEREGVVRRKPGERAAEATPSASPRKTS